MKDSINEIKYQVILNKLTEGNYCVIVYEVKPVKHILNKITRLIYKNVKDFEERVEEDIENFDNNNGIYFEWRIYD